jgi:hypothetical protein
MKISINIQEERDGIPLTGLTHPHFYACPKPGPGFPTSYVVLCSASSVKMRGDFSFVDIVKLQQPDAYSFLYYNN